MNKRVTIIVIYNAYGILEMLFKLKLLKNILVLYDSVYNWLNFMTLLTLVCRDWSKIFSHKKWYILLIFIM